MGTRIGFRATVTEAFAATVIGESGHASRRPAPFRTDRLPDVGDIVGGHYRLVRLLGKGMFGKVYVAQRVDVPEHQVALKLVPRSVYSGRNVERELVMLATAATRNVVQLKDHGTTDGYVWLTMPVYEGETLAERLERGAARAREAHDIFLPIARGLDALHKAGLRHQDIKPENIFLATFRRARAPDPARPRRRGRARGAVRRGHGALRVARAALGALAAARRRSRSARRWTRIASRRRCSCRSSGRRTFPARGPSRASKS